MRKYRCVVCDWVYNPEDWTCPLCGVTKADFELVEE